jgi:phosphate transport system substrate-binding protein
VTPRLDRPNLRVRRIVLLLAVLAFAVAVTYRPTEARAQQGYQRISGEGSSWAANAIDAMRVNVRQFGITVDYNPSGSSAGRKNFLNGTVDFAASDIPFQFQPEDGSAPENPAPGSYAYMPVVAGGTAFIYNLKINGKRVTNLRLSGENVSKIFTGVLTQWNDPVLQKDNPGIVLPARKIVPVVRSDGSGSTAQFTAWMIDRYPGIWNDYCSRSGRAPACGFTSFYPTIPGMIAQSGDLGVAGYVSAGYAEGTIGYVNYSYALGVQFPVAKLLNAAGYYTEPTPQNVAVSLLKARINTDASNPSVYLTQNLDLVYVDPDPRNYQLSYYSYFILPTKVGGQFNEAKGRTLGAFTYYAMCQAQQQSESLGYSPMPINLVEAGFDQIRKIPGVVVQDIDIKSCKNPTFSPDGANVLAKNAPAPQACDKAGGSTQCPNGTGGLRNVPTAVTGGAAAAVTTAPPAVATTRPAAATATTRPAGSAGGGAAPAPGAEGGAPVVGGEAPAGGGVSAAPTTAADGSGSPAPAGETATTVPGVDGAAGDATLAAVTDTSVADPEAVADPAAAGGSCDPDTGLCEDAATSSGGDEAAIAVPVGPATPVTLDQGGGWGAAQTLIVLVTLLVLALVLAPAFAWRYFSQRGPT